MILTLVVPLIFMVFGKFSLDRVWGMYNLMQILVSLTMLDC